jgi:flavin reductase (DIM6/NTAB) family NADH-FMN oxidoreductase RutF
VKSTDIKDNIKSFTLSVPVQGMEGMLQTLVVEDALGDALRETIPAMGSNDYRLKGIKGSVAHLHCRVYDSHPQGSSENDKTCTVFFAQVEEAFVHSDYWDAAKRRFAPKLGCVPYLKRFGSDQFGYVWPTSTSSFS